MKPEEAGSALIMQFAKWPEAGKVKTRLMPALGEAGALEAHIVLSLMVLDHLTASGFDVRFLWDRQLQQVPKAAEPIVQRLGALNVAQGVQEGSVLGERMTAALAGGLCEYSKAVIVGSDCPSVDSDYVHQAISALECVDVVLGPSDDGGYVLIGARRMADGMLENVNWGTEGVMAQTIERLEAAGLSYTLLPMRWDVDEPEDWQRFNREFPGHIQIG